MIGVTTEPPELLAIVPTVFISIPEEVLALAEMLLCS